MKLATLLLFALSTFVLAQQPAEIVSPDVQPDRKVTFRFLTDREIAWYVETNEWRHRAGGYAIQGRGAALVERIEGDFWNVVGLPVPTLLNLQPPLLSACPLALT